MKKNILNVVLSLGILIAVGGCSSGTNSQPPKLSDSLKSPTEATNGQSEEYDYNFIASKSNACIVDNEAIKCWGYKSLPKKISLSKIKNLRQMVIVGNQLCILDGNEIKCFYSDNDYTSPKTPNDRTGFEVLQLTSYEDRACAIFRDPSSQRKVVECWGLFTPFTYIGDSALKLSQGLNHWCAIKKYEKRNYVECECISAAEGSCKEVLTTPNVDEPRKIVSGESHSCVLDKNSVKCWGRNDLGQTNVPELKNPRELKAGRDQTCALDDEGLKCWGKNIVHYGNGPVSYQPPVANGKVLAFAVGYPKVCIIDSEGVKCEGHLFSAAAEHPMPQFYFGNNLPPGPVTPTPVPNPNPVPAPQPAALLQEGLYVGADSENTILCPLKVSSKVESNNVKQLVLATQAPCGLRTYTLDCSESTCAGEYQGKVNSLAIISETVFDYTPGDVGQTFRYSKK